jgi:hypothetical protein
MNQQDLRDLLKQTPFQPFRLHLTDGRSFAVPHPEMVLPLPRSAVVAVGGEPDHGLYERAVTIVLLYIVRVEPLEVTAKGNGQAPN